MSDPSSLPHQPPPRTSGYYIAFFLVALVWSLTPLSWAYILWCLYAPPSAVGQVLLIWAVLEAAFSIYHAHLARSIQPLRPNTPDDIVTLRQSFIRVLQAGLAPAPALQKGDLARPESPMEHVERLEKDDHRAVDFRQRIRTWFRKAPWDEITRESMLTWLAWSCFDLPLADCLASSVRRTLLYEALELIERRSGTIFPEGPMTVVPLRLTMDPIAVWGRPLVMYAVVGLLSYSFRVWYQVQHGFQVRRFGEIDYLLRIPEGWTPALGQQARHAPVVLFHGLGIGLMQYKNLLHDLASSLPDHPLLIPLQPHISQDILHPQHLAPPGRKETVSSLKTAIDALSFGPDSSGQGGVVFLSHSNGTIAHAWMMKDHPTLLRRSCFVDPVTFCLWEGDVCYNFVYRTPSCAMELLMWYFVGSELGVANALQRHFVWSSNILWYEEIRHARDPAKFVVLLGGKDVIVDTERVKRYLCANGVREGCVFDQEGRHGSALLRDEKGLRTVVDWVKGEWKPE
ncbi:hypothetical protein DACRYDRAFT_112859 [Dacryopinax primogenitus]|uniref:Alpha/beta-hydrolase n=1 Tax=Dacryopinax primogenitus (strain DJM 731) TaxID=1858805 RepID=M5GAZ4_DACPD|nr:uncharacterized protein DACRYDRAFT_112859 [Dacryopinax primogenitus]EJU06079.1 hypothetical protein DACRYDRAFT_112859 [Dacryopinax primogenitus]